MNKIHPRIIISLVFSLCFFAACKKNEEVKIKLSYSEKRVVDTLFLAEMLMIGPEMDSICEAKFETNVQGMLDSMLTSRRLDEERLRKKFQLEAKNRK